GPTNAALFATLSASRPQVASASPPPTILRALSSLHDPAASNDPRIGRLLGGTWRVRRLLAVGGMSAVYVATRHDGTPVAVKVLDARFARVPEARDRFLREAEIAN